MDYYSVDPHLIDILTLRGTEGESYEHFDQAFREGYTAARDNNFPVQTAFQERFIELMEREGLADYWLTTICLTTFAQGVAVGRGADVIEAQDVHSAMENLCDAWPDCLRMRLQAYVDALRELIGQDERRAG